MFTNENWIFLSSDLSKEWAELEDKIKLYQSQSLMNGINKSFEEWLKEQQSNCIKFDEHINKLIKDYKERINLETKKVYETVDDVVAKEINKASEEDALNGQKEPLKEVVVQKIYDENNKSFELLSSSASTMNKEAIYQVYSYKTLKNVNTLFEAVRRYSNDLPNAMKVTYSNGRQVTFKSYMEMKIRTSLQEEANNLMEEVNAQAGVVFYLCNALGDSADDHAKYQGKVYITSNWRNSVVDDDKIKAIERFISSHKTMTIEEVKDKPIWLTTRPNCRHFFTPITIEQAINYKDTLKELKLEKKGKYVDDNYEDLKKQRYNERAIRHYKQLENQSISQLEKVSKTEQKASLIADINRYKHLKTKWQAAQRELCQSNPNLVRTYNREFSTKMAYDLGVSRTK